MMFLFAPKCVVVAFGRFAVRQENDLMFLETSALTGEGIGEVFLKCARTILSKIETGQIDPESMGSGVQHGDARVGRGADAAANDCVGLAKPLSLKKGE